MNIRPEQAEDYREVENLPVNCSPNEEGRNSTSPVCRHDGKEAI